MAIEMMSDRDNDVKAVFETAYLKLLDVEVCASSGNVRLPYYLYADREARNAEHPLQVKQGVETCALADLAPVTFDRDGLFQAGYAVLKSRGFAGADV